MITDMQKSGIIQSGVSNNQASGTVTSNGLQLAMMITTGPIILVYPFLQKYFVKGLTIGSVKA